MEAATSSSTVVSRDRVDHCLVLELAPPSRPSHRASYRASPIIALRALVPRVAKCWIEDVAAEAHSRAGALSSIGDDRFRHAEHGARVASGRRCRLRSRSRSTRATPTGCRRLATIFVSTAASPRIFGGTTCRRDARGRAARGQYRLPRYRRWRDAIENAGALCFQLPRQPDARRCRGLSNAEPILRRLGRVAYCELRGGASGQRPVHSRAMPMRLRHRPSTRAHAGL